MNITRNFGINRRNRIAKMVNQGSASFWTAVCTAAVSTVAVEGSRNGIDLPLDDGRTPSQSGTKNHQ